MFATQTRCRVNLALLVIGLAPLISQYLSRNHRMFAAHVAIVETSLNEHRQLVSILQECQSKPATDQVLTKGSFGKWAGAITGLVTVLKSANESSCKSRCVDFAQFSVSARRAAAASARYGLFFSAISAFGRWYCILSRIVTIFECEQTGFQFVPRSLYWKTNSFAETM